MVSINKNIAPDSPFDHLGELAMRERFPSCYEWNEYTLSRMITDSISARFAEFIEAQYFFFIATANDQGHCDASFRGTELSATGEMLPVCKVLDSKRLVFPDYSGNGLYNSLGNILTNPHIGMLFVDFSRQSRARINGKADIMAIDDDIKKIWPKAQAYIQVNVEQVYGNCPARIPRMQRVD